ncbi:T9SS type B sorting domain-containing protein [Catalinimonas niigatensis]|uniref:T9SS type B sorting domain-containing protein n=1 Tax=Catalinimonas niigatensis TaxID=1397264 RepID=UPI002666B788|nr:gliding motility-associated C-terminal domain-containing protein [Catalinimonas niigatensis]WPP50641.1 gliding motility-associated C-terminal domain-containing protein [Catalinimonas niigatensis]
MKKIVFFAVLIIIFFLGLIHNSFAQQEAANWYFGDYAGIQFSSCTSTALTDSEMYAEEGTAVMSDSDGNLLFYTNGLSIWNHQHQVMENGKLPLHWKIQNEYDSTTTTQAALIVPDPGEEKQYYVFLTSPRSGNISDGRFCYVKVDMAANDGTGKVLSSPICLADSLTERLTAVHHANGKDIWVMTQSFETAEILAFLVNEEGINLPIKSPTGKNFTRTTTRENATGQMKVSPDGKKLAYTYWEPAMTYFYQNYIGVMDFDATTGKATNPSFAEIRLMQELYFGIEFSPQSSYLYVSSNRKVMQFSINPSDNTLTNRTELYDFGEVSPVASTRHSLQLAPNGYIYVANNFYLDAILYPDLAGKSATYVPYYQELGGGTTAKVGLPNFIQSYFLISPTPPHCDIRLEKFESCVPDTSIVSLVTPYPEQIDSVIWETSKPTYPPHIQEFSIRLFLTTDWTMNVSATVYFKDGKDTTLTTPLNVERLTLQLPADTAICRGDTLWLNTPNKGYYYLERNNYGTIEKVETEGGRWPITEFGHYKVYQTFGKCYISDVINVNVIEPPAPVDLGEDTVLCKNSFTWTLYATQPDNFQTYTYLWQDGSQEEMLVGIYETGTYWVRVENECGWQIDTIHITFEEPLLADLGEDVILCEGETLTLSVDDSPASWSWSTGSTDASITINKAGTYWVEMSNSCGWVRDSIMVIYDQWHPLTLPDSVMACTNETVSLDAGPHYRNYQWSSGERSPVITATQSGWYEVEVANACGVQTARTWVELIQPENTLIPNVITPNDDGQNDFFRLHQTLQGSRLTIYNRWGKKLYQDSAYQNTWKGEGLSSGVYFYTLDHP